MPSLPAQLIREQWSATCDLIFSLPFVAFWALGFPESSCLVSRIGAGSSSSHTPVKIINLSNSTTRGRPPTRDRNSRLHRAESAFLKNKRNWLIPSVQRNQDRLVATLIPALSNAISYSSGNYGVFILNERFELSYSTLVTLNGHLVLWLRLTSETSPHSLF